MGLGRPYIHNCTIAHWLDIALLHRIYTLFCFQLLGLHPLVCGEVVSVIGVCGSGGCGGLRRGEVALVFVNKWEQ